MTHTIEQTVLAPELKQVIYAEFSKHAIISTGIDGLSQNPIAFEIREGQNFIGCVVVQLFWGQLHIKYLVVEEPYRGKGIGRQLLEHAFEFGRNQGCTFVFVETMNFQAPGFYERLGFQIELTRPGFDKNTSMHYLKRDL